MIANLGWMLRAWPPRVASRCFEPRIERALANAICERFLGSVRRECLDHFLIFHEKQLSRVLRAYITYFNQARPLQGVQQRIPDPPALSAPLSHQPSKVCAVPVLGGLHHNYRRVA